jgi:hypothetical protein
VITMGMILHDWNLEKKMKLIRAAYHALPPGGPLVAVEALIDNARRENVFGLLMSLNMLIEFGDAFDYSAADFKKWCREIGFKRFEVLHLAGPSSAAIAYKIKAHCFGRQDIKKKSVLIAVYRFATPWQLSFDFQLERQAKKCADEHNQSKDKHVLNRGCDDHGSDNVARNQKFQAQ